MRYKSEFNQYYAKYRTLHKVLDQVSKKFAHLESRLKEAQKGSQDFKVSFKSEQMLLMFEVRCIRTLGAHFIVLS